MPHHTDKLSRGCRRMQIHQHLDWAEFTCIHRFLHLLNPFLSQFGPTERGEKKNTGQDNKSTNVLNPFRVILKYIAKKEGERETTQEGEQTLQYASDSQIARR